MLLRYWSRVGRLKELVAVVKVRIRSRILDLTELPGLPVLLELELELLVLRRSDIVEFGILGTQVDFR